MNLCGRPLLNKLTDIYFFKSQFIFVSIQAAIDFGVVPHLDTRCSGIYAFFFFLR